MYSLSAGGWFTTCTKFSLPSDQSPLFRRNFYPILRPPAPFLSARTPTVASVLRSTRSVTIMDYHLEVTISPGKDFDHSNGGDPLHLQNSNHPVSEWVGEDILQSFLKERQLKGDLVAKVSDTLWLREVIDIADAEASVPAGATQLSEETAGNDNQGGFLKMTRTLEWLLGDNPAPVNRKMVIEELRNDNEGWKRLNLLHYEALKRELFLLTVAIGTACGGYCVVALSVQAAVSYWAGVLFSCLYLQLLYQHADSLSKETVPLVFMQKRAKKIGIRSQDLKDLFARWVKGCSIALSSPRLVIPVAIYGLWELSQHFTNDFFDFQLVPAIFGMFAYKAAVLFQVYRDNKGLQFDFPENEEELSD